MGAPPMVLRAAINSCLCTCMVMAAAAAGTAFCTLIYLQLRKSPGQPRAIMKEQALGAVAFPASLPYFGLCCARRTLCAEAEYLAVCQAFCKCHSVPLNVAVHFVCNPLMLYGWMCCFNDVLFKGSSLLVALFYVVVLARVLPKWNWFVTTMVTAGICLLARLLPLGAWGAVLSLSNEVLTRYSHDLTEPAFVSSYAEEPTCNFLRHLFLHYFFLLPMGLEAGLRCCSLRSP